MVTKNGTALMTRTSPLQSVGGDRVFEIRGDDLLRLYEDVRRYASSLVTLSGILLDIQGPDPQLQRFFEDAAVDALLAAQMRDALLLELPPAIRT